MFSKLVVLLGVASLAKGACTAPGMSLESGKEYTITTASGNDRLYHLQEALTVFQIPGSMGEPDWFFRVEPQQDGTYIFKTVEQTQKDPWASRRRKGQQPRREDRFLQAQQPKANETITFAESGSGTAFNLKSISDGAEGSKCFNIVHPKTGLAWTETYTNWEPIIRLQDANAQSKRQQFCFE